MNEADTILRQKEIITGAELMQVLRRNGDVK